MKGTQHFYGFVADKRSRWQLKRLRKIRKRIKKRRENSRFILYTSTAIDLLASHCKQHWNGSGKIGVNIPKVFSVIENPEITIKTILLFTEAIRSKRIKQVYFDHSNLKSIDLAAETIFDFIVLELNRESRSRKRSLDIVGGHYPKDPDLKRYLKAVGIIKNLGIRHEYLDPREEGKLEIFRMRNKKLAWSRSAGSADYKDKAVKDFVDHVDKCLSHRSKRLSKYGIKSLTDFTGEVLDNAEEHTDLDDWTIVGYLDSAKPEQICEIAIFNFGNTYADTFKELDKNDYAYKAIEKYIEVHRKSGLFSSGWKEEDLLTVVALQESISSKNRSSEDTRGSGTITLLEFFQRIHQECNTKEKPCIEMCILSGSTFIMFDGTYKLELDKSGRKIIAFNRENSLEKTPDKKYVRNLDKFFFPGTIISIRFPLNSEKALENIPA